MSRDTARVQCAKCGSDLTTEQFPSSNSIVKCINCGTSGRYEDVMSEATNQVMDAIAKDLQKEFKEFKIDMKF
jgi:predicted nucleic-acid-binding Zn-ribbon protein